MEITSAATEMQIKTD